MTAPSPPKPPEPTEIVETEAMTVACDGNGPFGHPRVFLTLVGGRVMCPYCSRLFVLKGAKAA